MPCYSFEEPLSIYEDVLSYCSELLGWNPKVMGLWEAWESIKLQVHFTIHFVAFTIHLSFMLVLALCWYVSALSAEITINCGLSCLEIESKSYEYRYSVLCQCVYEFSAWIWDPKPLQKSWGPASQNPTVCWIFINFRVSITNWFASIIQLHVQRSSNANIWMEALLFEHEGSYLMM